MSEVSCFIYKTEKWDGMYLYVLEEDDFSEVSEEIMKKFPHPEFVFELSLSADKPLARENVVKVLENLKALGFHLQMPPSHKEVIRTFPTRDELDEAKED